MLLAIDIGNTNIVIGIFDGEKLRATWRLGTDVHKLEDEYAGLFSNLWSLKGLAFDDIDSAIIASSVPPLVTVFEELCRRYLGVTPMVVGPGVRTGVRIALENPREVGADRVVNAAAAHRLYGGPLIVIDFGTATTFDCVTQDGTFLGGVIAPGIQTAAQNLHRRTAKLPVTELVPPERIIGRRTEECIRAGVLFGTADSVDGIVRSIKQEWPREEIPLVVATGGLAEPVAHHCHEIEIVEPNLTLLGLHIAARHLGLEW